MLAKTSDFFLHMLNISIQIMKYYSNVFLLSNINVFKHFISLHKKIELQENEEKEQP